MAEIKLLVADEHPLFMEGICSLLKEEPDIVVKGALSAKETMQFNQDFRPDVIIIDSNISDCNGSFISKLLEVREEKVGVLIMSTSGFDSAVIKLFRAGANGFILKNISRFDLILAVKTVLKGDYYLCKDAADIIVDLMSQSKSFETGNPIKDNTLSKREKDILKYISFGFTNSEIAEKLFISSHTVATHRRNLLQKINVKNTAGLVLYASRLGLLN